MILISSRAGAHRHRCRALSMTELLITIAVISILAAVSAVAVSQVTQNAQSQKLNSDVSTLNSAIRIYLSNGGNLDSVATANDVLTKLKTSRTKADKETHVGAPSGRMIDNRVSTSPVAANSWRARAVYNVATQRFEIVENQAGIEFTLDDDLAEVRAGNETRDPNAVSYAANSTWVWDHASTDNPTAPDGPSTFAINTNVVDSDPNATVVVPVPPTSSGGGGGGSTDPTTTPELPRLPWPRLNLDGGAHPEDDFMLSVVVQNVPPAADADPVYQINGGSWSTYGGPIDIDMNDTLRVQFRTLDSSRFRDGNTRTEFYYPVPDTLSGTVNGDFFNASGGPNLKYEITNGADTFTHGDPIYILDGEPINSGDPNVLEFTGRPFADVAPGEQFKLGEFYYRNGNSYYDSHATGVKLRVTINLPERGETFSFDLNLDLVNTPNDPDDPDASADFVKITNLQQNVNLQINGVGYRMKLEFGATDSFGFSTESSFHVYEGATGRGDLIGTFLAN